MIIPPEAYGVRCISMGFFVEEDQPVIWRGPMLHKALEQFLTDVYWDDPDYLLVDLPPGTGDISLSLAQFLPRAELYVVTTPQPAAQKVAQRAAFMAEKVSLDVKGVIENMSWFTGDDGTRYEIFGAGGGQELAERLDVPLLGQDPARAGAARGRRRRPSDHGRRPRVARRRRPSPRSPSASTSSWPRPVATTPSSPSSELPHHLSCHAPDAASPGQARSSGRPSSSSRSRTSWRTTSTGSGSSTGKRRPPFDVG